MWVLYRLVWSNAVVWTRNLTGSRGSSHESCFGNVFAGGCECVYECVSLTLECCVDSVAVYWARAFCCINHPQQGLISWPCELILRPWHSTLLLAALSQRGFPQRVVCENAWEGNEGDLTCVWFREEERREEEGLLTCICVLQPKLADLIRGVGLNEWGSALECRCGDPVWAGEVVRGTGVTQSHSHTDWVCSCTLFWGSRLYEWRCVTMKALSHNCL